VSDVAYEGGCHCGRVRFRIRVAENAHEAIVCSCSVCTKKGIVHLIVEASRFDLVSGRDELSTYTFGTHTAQHWFCRTCGMHPFYKPRSHPEAVDVNLRCLDEPDDIAKFRIVDFDGRNWEANVHRIR
jgi:hypothetical protein